MKKQFEKVQNCLEDVHTGVAQLPEQNKEKLIRHKKLMKTFVKDQIRYEFTIKAGRECIASCDDPLLRNMIIELNRKRINLCNMFVDLQKKLEKAILVSIFSKRIKISKRALKER